MWDDLLHALALDTLQLDQHAKLLQSNSTFVYSYRLVNVCLENERLPGSRI